MLGDACVMRPLQQLLRKRRTHRDAYASTAVFLLLLLLLLLLSGVPRDEVLPCRRYHARACGRWPLSRLSRSLGPHVASTPLIQIVRKHPQGLLQ